MVEVAYSGGAYSGGAYSGSTNKLKSSFRCGSSGFRLGAKNVLDLSTATCTMTTALNGDGAVTGVGFPIEERVPSSPRRHLMRSLIESRGERQAVREQRRLEIERELILKLGLDPATPSQPMPASPAAGRGASACSVDAEGAHSTEATPASSIDGRPPSRGSDRPSSRAGLTKGGSGPSRPPKPKPHRPLNLGEESPASVASANSAAAIPGERRWKSAFPFLPDRQGSEQAPEGAAEKSSATSLEESSLQSKQTLDLLAPIAALCIQSPLSAPPASSSSSAPQEPPPSLQLANAAEEPPPSLQLANAAEEPSQPSASAAVLAAAANAAAVAAAASAATAKRLKEAEHERLEEEMQVAERTRQLEASAQRLRDNVQRLKFENRRSRVLGPVITSTRAAPLTNGGATSPPSSATEAVSAEDQAIAAAPRLSDLCSTIDRQLAMSLPCSPADKQGACTATSTHGHLLDAVVPAEASDCYCPRRLASEHCDDDYLFAAPCARGTASVAEQQDISLSHCSPPPMPETAGSVSGEQSWHVQVMRRKIAELDKVNELERQRLDEEQREVEERRRQQEEFERGLQERTERDILEHRAREAEAERARALREQEQQHERHERGRKRKEQLAQERERSKRLEEHCREGRSEATQAKWQLFEEELDKHWAQQETEQRRHVDQYAKDRQRRHEDSDRRFASERQKFASEAEHMETTRRRRHVRNMANADEQFYGAWRGRVPSTSAGGAAPSGPQRAPWPPPPKPPPPSSGPVLNADECAVLKELQSLRSLPRESQKAKVKELLFRWHPDKNPTCTEKATRVFQFLQRQREVVLGL